ncbi:hypothetical protein PGTUg99_020084 [Puccinia graminis f. sp. tritici]|uniref:Uncharacterized protein n=1 Tax=Puccinia graminis f. sp. tritici TaxID=56615 RepID=A0A5B0RLH1_PUCGR|nr:hypothetical protein PGTUg99_020084 [Puccinia graminis f. sp. tritici]
MKQMRCVHQYRIASQGAMRGPASHRPHRHNRCGESASHRFSDAMPDTWLAMPMLSAVDSSIGLDPLSSVPCSGLKFQVSTHDYEGRYRSASEKTSRQPEEAESDRWLQSQLDSDRTTGPYLELDCTEYNLIRDHSEVPIKKKLVSVPPPAARITLGTASNTITRLHQLPPPTLLHNHSQALLHHTTTTQTSLNHYTSSLHTHHNPPSPHHCTSTC